MFSQAPSTTAPMSSGKSVFSSIMTPTQTKSNNVTCIQPNQIIEPHQAPSSSVNLPELSPIWFESEPQNYDACNLDDILKSI